MVLKVINPLPFGFEPGSFIFSGGRFIPVRAYVYSGGSFRPAAVRIT